MDEGEVLEDCSVVTVVGVVAKDGRDDDVVAWEDVNELGNGLLVPEDEEKSVDEAEDEGEFEEDEGKELEVEARF